LVAVDRRAELVDDWGNFKSLEENSLLALQKDVTRPRTNLVRSLLGWMSPPMRKFFGFFSKSGFVFFCARLACFPVCFFVIFFGCGVVEKIFTNQSARSYKRSAYLEQFYLPFLYAMS
jgi:hypothetical protein